MPPKNCGSCQKLVYPMDELKCLDKTWHKACFRCQVCSMTLNMKNYKGYNKLPYCNAHYPTTKFTAVADTPENMRIKKNTKIQSNVKYHEEFEAAKGQYTAVADDPETMRVRKNMSTISNVAYHGEMQRKLEMENARPSEIEASSNGSMGPPAAPAAPAARSRKPGSISDYDPAGESRPSPFSSRTQSTTAYASANGQRQVSIEQPASTPAPVAAPRVASQPSPAPRQSSPPPLDRQTSPPVARQPPVRDSSPPPVIRQSSPPVAREPSPPPVRQPSPPPVRQPSPPPVREPSPPPVREPSPPPVREPSPPPVREPSPPPVREPSPPPVREPSPPPVREPSPLPVREPSPPPVREPSPPPVVPEPSPPATANPYEGKGNVSMAVYEYAAGDDDEVSFEEGDIIIHCDPIDEGWMNGTVEKSGQSGMLPSNYVERVNW